MDKHVIVYEQKGHDGVKVMAPVSRSVAQCLVKLKEDLGSDLVSYRIVDKDKVPKDRYFRDAWVACEYEGVKHDIEKCKEVHKDKLRLERNKKLAALDAPMMRAMELEDLDQIAELKKLKQDLRDLPESFDMDSLNTLDEIRMYRPDIL